MYIFLLAVGLHVLHSELSQERIDFILGVLLHLLRTFVFIFWFHHNLNELKCTFGLSWSSRTSDSVTGLLSLLISVG